MGKLLSSVQGQDAFWGIVVTFVLLILCEEASRYWAWKRGYDDPNYLKNSGGLGAALFFHFWATGVNAMGLALGILAIFALHLPYSGVALVVGSVVGYVFFEKKAHHWDQAAHIADRELAEIDRQRMIAEQQALLKSVSAISGIGGISTGPTGVPSTTFVLSGTLTPAGSTPPSGSGTGS